MTRDDNVCHLTLASVTPGDSGTQETGTRWTCDQGEGEVNVYLTVLSLGTLSWLNGI